MNRIFWLGATAGVVSGILGAILVSQYDLSLFSVAVIGGIVGMIIGWLFKLQKKT